MSDYIPKVGDRVRVRMTPYDGVIEDFRHGELTVRGDSGQSGPSSLWFEWDSALQDTPGEYRIERLPDPEPEWKPGDVVLDADGDAYVRSATGGWWFEGDCYSDGVPRRPLTRLVPEGKPDRGES